MDDDTVVLESRLTGEEPGEPGLLGSHPRMDPLVGLMSLSGAVDGKAVIMPVSPAQ